MSEKPVKQLIRYYLEENHFFREDPDKGEVNKIARYDREKKLIAFLPGMERFRVPLQAHMNDKGYPYKEFVVLDSEEAEPKTDVVPANAPPRPKVDPRAGDKSPKLMKWLWKYKREEFKARYGMVGIDEATGKPITLRKTPFSVQAGSGTMGEEYETDETLNQVKFVRQSSVGVEEGGLDE